MCVQKVNLKIGHNKIAIECRSSKGSYLIGVIRIQATLFFCRGMQCGFKIALMLAFVTLTVGTLVEIHLGT